MRIKLLEVALETRTWVGLTFSGGNAGEALKSEVGVASDHSFSLFINGGVMDELDKLAAEKVMGWVAGHGHWIGPLNTPQGTKTMWQPTRNISQAWECLEKVSGSNFCALIYHPRPKCWACQIEIPTDKFSLEIEADGDTAPEAIVRACLRAKGVEV